MSKLIWTIQINWLEGATFDLNLIWFARIERSAELSQKKSENYSIQVISRVAELEKRVDFEAQICEIRAEA